MARFLPCLVVALVALWSPAQATNSLAATHLEDFVSEEGEPLVDFLARVGGKLHAFTRETGHEGCGAIASNGEAFSIRLYSDDVPHGCVINPKNVMEGFAFTGETLHSHPWQKVLTLNPRARAWSRLHNDGNAGAPTLRNDGAGGFSRADLAGGPGWLVARGQLLHQANGTTTRHGPVR